MKQLLKSNNIPVDVGMLVCYAIENGLIHDLIIGANDIIPKLISCGIVARDYDKGGLKIVNPDIEATIHERIDDFRDLFRGIKTGSMGSRSACKAKLIRWFKENPGYSFEDVMNATSYYINNKQSEGSGQYIRRADYFIYKHSGNKTEELSDLSAVIDEGKDYKIGVTDANTFDV